MREFNATTRHPRMVAAFHRNDHVVGNLLPGFYRFGIADQHVASHNQRLRPRPAIDQATFDEQLVETDFLLH